MISKKVNGLKNAMEKLSIPRGIIITYDDDIKINDTIAVVPFWKLFAAEDIVAA